MNQQTQTQAVLDHMRSRGSINPLVALRRYGCFRLAARIRDLRDDGYLINAVIVSKRGKKYAAYSLVEGKRAAA
jgi:hypothetical protein